jgi:hypothetical protein
MLVWLHLGALFLQVELNIFLIITSTTLEVDVIRLSTQRIMVGKLGIGPLHVEDPTFYQHLVVPTHGHFP